MRNLIAIAALAAIAAPATVKAEMISATGVTASSTFDIFGEYRPENLINGSGLSGALHDASYTGMWMTNLGVSTGSLVFDLGASRAIEGISIWNYNFGTPGFLSTLDRGAQGFTVSLSSDNASFTQALAGSLTRGTGQPIAAESFGLAGTGRYVRLDLTSNFADPLFGVGTPVGLSEVRFAVSAVPEPASWVMMIGGFGLIGGAMRRARKQAAVRFA